MICDVSLDCTRCQSCWTCDEWGDVDEDDEEDDDFHYPPCPYVEDCADCSHENECFPNI